MAHSKKLSRNEIDSKFIDIQNRIIRAPGNAARQQVIREHWDLLYKNIVGSDDFGDIDPLQLAQRMRDHVDQLGSTALPKALPLLHFENKLRSENKDKPRGPRHYGKGLIEDE